MDNILSKRGRWVCCLLLAFTFSFFFSGCDDDNDNDNLEDAGENFVTGITAPWEMEFDPTGNLFVTQRGGVVSVISPSGVISNWLELDSVVEAVGESGLFGIELDPEYQTNSFVYLTYTYAAEQSPLRLVNKIVRYRNENGKPKFDKVLIDGIRGNHLHNAGALEFGPDGMLYVTVGEVYQPDLAQDVSSLNGKILRMTREGSVPGDNPFTSSYVYSLGHRNPQGIAFHPTTKALWSTEHGPSEDQGCCMDEINLIEAGKNYGWPMIRGGQQQEGLQTPKYFSGDTTTWAPAGGFFLTQGEWAGSFVFTGLRGKALYRVIFNAADPTKVDAVERYLYNAFGRLRNVAEGPDGKLYIAVSNQDGRGDPLTIDDRIVVLTQAEIRKFKN